MQTLPTLPTLPTPTEARPTVLAAPPVGSVRAVGARGDELQAHLCRNIRRLANHRQVTLSAMADQAGVAKAQLYRVVSGQSSPSLDWIAKLARGLKIDPFSLLQPANVIGPAAGRCPRPVGH